MAGVLLANGLSENVSDDGLDPIDDGGSEARVPFREPLGVKIFGWSVVADVCVNRPCELRSLRAVHWVSHVTLCGCMLGSGVMRIVGAVVVEGSQFVSVLSSQLGTWFMVLQSWL